MPAFSYRGLRLHYRERGSGPLLLILPGNTASSAAHDGELEHFSRQFRTIALDLPGTGQSDRLDPWPDDWWELGASAAAALLEHLGGGPSLVMGTSGGASIALLMAIRSPERVRGVVADSCVEQWPAETLLANMAQRKAGAAEAAPFWQHCHGDDWQEVIAADTQFLERWARVGRVWEPGALGQIRCPVLFAASLQDELLPEVEAQVLGMARQIPGSQLFLANAGNHPLMWSCPAAFRRAADTFLAGLEEATGKPCRD